MKKLLLLLLFITTGAWGQSGYTNVTATVQDANKVPYANGRVSVTLPQGEVFIGTGLQPPNSGSAQMDSTGTFSLRLASNDQLSPSGSKWTFNICNSAGTTCFSSQQTVTGTSQSLSSALSTASSVLPVPTDFVREFLLQAAPANPPTGYILLYGDSGTGNLTCLTSVGAACISGGGGGGAPTIQVNGVNTANQSTINFQDSAVANGLSIQFSNPSVGNIKPSLNGTLANGGLQNSSLTVNTSSPLGGGGAVSLGSSLTLTCATCATSANNLSFFAATTSAQLAGVISNETGSGLLVFNDSPTFTTKITSPIIVSGAADLADAGFMRMGNAEVLAWEANPAGTDLTLGVDTSNILQSSANFNAPVLTEGGSAVPNSTDNLSFFSSTTSAQLAGVISNETGTGVLVFNTSPAFSGTPTTPTATPLTGGTQIASQAYVDAAVTAGGGSGANAALSNLASVAVNASLIAGADNTIDIGSNAAKWRTGYFGTGVNTPQVATSGTNGGFDGLEGTGAGLTAASSHDLLWPDSTAHRWKVNNNNGGADTLATFLDKLNVFAATTSAELAGVISDETGTGKLTFATAPTFVTSITTPVMISGAADPADAGAIRLGNAENIAWENATPGTDLTLTMNASNVLAASTPISATTGFQIGGAAASNHCLLGNGTNYVDSTSCLISGGALGTPSSATLTNATGLPGAGIVSASVTATQLAAQYSKGACTEVWGGSGTSFALTSGDDAISNNSCYNDSGVTRTITAVKCRSDNASNTTTVNPTFGSAGTGTTILSGALTCGNSYAYSSSGTVSNASWTTGTGINPVQGGTLTGTSIAMIVEFTY